MFNSFICNYMYYQSQDYQKRANIDNISKYPHKHARSDTHTNLLAYTRTRTHTYTDVYSHPQKDLFRSIRTHQCG